MIHISDSDDSYAFDDDIESADSSLEGWGEGVSSASRKRARSPEPKPAGNAAANDAGGAGGEADVQAGADKKPAAKKAPRKKPRKDLQSSMPLVLAKKYNKTYLMEVGHEVDLTGDMATVGLMHVNTSNSKRPVRLDLKGVVYRGAPRKCNTFAVVDIVTANTTTTVGDDTVQVASQEAKITHIIDGYLCMDKDDATEQEVVFEGDMDDVAFQTSEDVTKSQKDQDLTKKKKAKPKTKRKAPASKKKK